MIFGLEDELPAEFVLQLPNFNSNWFLDSKLIQKPINREAGDRLENVEVWGAGRPPPDPNPLPKGRFLIEIRTHPDLGSGELFSLETKNPKAPQTYSASFLTNSFRIHFGKTRKPNMFMVFGPGGRDHDSKKQLCSSLETPELHQMIQEPPNHFRYFFMEISTCRNYKF